MSDIVKYDNIFQYNEARGVETLHPLVSVIDFSKCGPARYERQVYGFYTVNPSAQPHLLMLRQLNVDRRQGILHGKGNLKLPWLKFSLPDLLLQCPDSSFQNPLYADDAVLIPA